MFKKIIKAMQVEHKTEKGTVLFVKLPDDSKARSNPFTEKYLTILNSNNEGYSLELPSLRFELIGLTSEVTEDQAKMMVDIYQIFMVLRYRHYNNGGWAVTALESFKSLMDHKVIYEVNPYPPCECKMFTQEFECCKNISLGLTTCKVFEKHSEAQSRTGKWIVLFKPNDK